MKQRRRHADIDNQRNSRRNVNIPRSAIVRSVAGNNNCVIVSRHAAKPLQLLLPEHSEHSGHCCFGIRKRQGADV